MADVLVICRYKDGTTDCDLLTTNTLSDLDIVVQEQLHEIEAFNSEDVKRIEFYIYVDGKFPKFILTKTVDL